MKGAYKDAKDWTIEVAGDWSQANGKYSNRKASKKIFFSGAIGLWYYMQGEFHPAIDCWQQELAIILQVEKKEEKRFHKGWFYYMIGLAYSQVKRKREAEKYFLVAEEEDVLTYGENAKNFPMASQ